VFNSQTVSDELRFIHSFI